jgi:hypothetical protein
MIRDYEQGSNQGFHMLFVISYEKKTQLQVSPTPQLTCVGTFVELSERLFFLLMLAD